MAQHPNYNLPSSIIAYMNAMSISMRKQYGQNFLINNSAREKLANAAISRDNKKLISAKVFEVGPGLGCMTEELLKRGATVRAFEVDKAFSLSLKSFFSEYIQNDKLNIIEGDVLKKWEKEAKEIVKDMKDEKEKDAFLPLTLFGNLPYNIAATLIAGVIEKSARNWGRMIFDKCVITVQKEVAKRMSSSPNSDDYSSLSVITQWAYKVETLLDLGPSAFWPRPNVSSRSLILNAREDFPRCIDSALFVKMTRALFSSRRKTIRNNLSRFLSNTLQAEKVLRDCGIDKDVRAEVLDIDTLLRVCDTIALWKTHKT